MTNHRRRLWTTIVFIALLIPFVVVFIVSLISSPAPFPLDPLATAPPTSAPTTNSVHTGTSSPRADVPLLAAGDGRDFWFVRPATSNNVPGYELFYRAGNTGKWSVALKNGSSFKWGVPQALALLPTDDKPSKGVPFVMDRSGYVDHFTLDSVELADSLPHDQIVRAAIGSSSGIFAITFGPSSPATQPGDRLNAELSQAPFTSDTLSLDNPITPSATISAASAPASSTAPLASSASLFNTCWFHDGFWTYLPPLGLPSTDSSQIPSPSSMLSLAVAADQLIAFWVDPIHPADLMVRTLNYEQAALSWSPPITTHLGEEVPTVSRLFTVTLDKTLFVLWTVPTGSSIALHGGWLNTFSDSSAFTLPIAHMLPPMPLGTAGTGISPATDVAAGPAGNSFLVVAITKEGTPAALLFDNRGHLLSGPSPVEPQSPRRELQVGQNIAMALFLLLLSLSLWQWRQQPVTLTLPTGLVIASLHLRAGAFLIDVAIPYAIVLAVFGFSDGPFAPLFSWFSAMAKPDDLFRATDLLVFLGLYLLHVFVGELFFGRSLGKALVGIQVLMLDGKSPTLAGVLIRNLARLPEFFLGLVIFYLAFSEHHQRLGDLLARTIVVSQQPPETPVDPDKEPPKK